MPKVIGLKDGRVTTLFEIRHFEDLIDEYMGYEAVQHFRELMADKEAELEEVKQEYENKLDRLRDKLSALEDEVKELHDKEQQS